MNRKEIILLLTGTFFLLLIIFAIATTAIGLIPFLFSKQLIDYIGVFLIISVFSFAFLTFSLFQGREDRIKKSLRIFVKSVCVVLSLVFVFVGIALTFIINKSLIKRAVSPDKKYELYIESDDLFGGWDVTVYKRSILSFKTCVNSDYIEEMYDSNGDIKVEWESDGCRLSYEYSGDYEIQEDETSFKIYFDSVK